MLTLAERAVRARNEKGLKPAEAARLIGIKAPSLWEIEHGETKSIRGKTLVKMAALYGVSERWLNEGIGPMHPTPEEQGARLSAEAAKIAADWMLLPPEMRETIASTIADMLHLAARLNIVQGVPDARVAEHIAPAPSKNVAKRKA